MRHDITQREAEAIRKGRASKCIDGLSSIELEAEAARGNRAAAEKLEELHALDTMELRAGTQ